MLVRSNVVFRKHERRKPNGPIAHLDVLVHDNAACRYWDPAWTRIHRLFVQCSGCSTQPLLSNRFFSVATPTWLTDVDISYNVPRETPVPEIPRKYISNSSASFPENRAFGG